MLGAQEKTPAEAGAGKACLLSHIKAPAQGGKAGGGKPPGPNLAPGLGGYKRLFHSGPKRQPPPPVPVPLGREPVHSATGRAS